MATNQQLLDEARTAFHQLMTGKLASVFVDQNGERVEYSKTNSAQLQAYITELERRVTGAGLGPMRVWL